MLGTVLDIRNNIVGKSSKSAKLNEEFLGRESSGEIAGSKLNLTQIPTGKRRDWGNW